MNIYSLRQYVELFHLLFIGQLVRKLDKRFYALKGGCNIMNYLLFWPIIIQQRLCTDRKLELLFREA